MIGGAIANLWALAVPLSVWNQDKDHFLSELPI